jgi:hypothetical protein
MAMERAMMEFTPNSVRGQESASNQLDSRSRRLGDHVRAQRILAVGLPLIYVPKVPVGRPHFSREISGCDSVTY